MTRGCNHAHVDDHAGGIEVEFQSDVAFASLGKRLRRVDRLVMGLK